MSAGEKELIDSGHLALEVFNALKDEFKVITCTVLLRFCLFAVLLLFSVFWSVVSCYQWKCMYFIIWLRQVVYIIHDLP